MPIGPLVIDVVHGLALTPLRGTLASLILALVRVVVPVDVQFVPWFWHSDSRSSSSSCHDDYERDRVDGDDRERDDDSSD